MSKEVQLDEKIIKRNKIPILIKDKQWLKLFNENPSKDIKKLSDKLEELISEEKEINKLLKEIHREKKILMNKVLKFSDEANTNNNEMALNELEHAKDRILKVNDEIDELKFKLEMLPNKIYNINLELLEKTVAISYEDIKHGKERVKYLDKEIKQIRKTLGGMWEEKFSKENRINDLYLYLHGTLGHEETDKLDKKFL